MRLKAAVLEVVRGAAGATLLVAVGCSGSESIAREPAGPVASPPVVANPPAVAPVAAPSPAPVAPGAGPAGKPSDPPSVVIAPVAPPDSPPLPGVEGVLVRTDPGSPGPEVDDDEPSAPEGTQNDRPVRRRRNVRRQLVGGINHAAAACGRG